MGTIRPLQSVVQVQNRPRKSAELEARARIARRTGEILVILLERNNSSVAVPGETHREDTIIVMG